MSFNMSPFTYLIHFVDLNFVKKKWGKNLVKAVFMSVHRWLASHSIQNQVKKRRSLKAFWLGLLFVV